MSDRPHSGRSGNFLLRCDYLTVQVNRSTNFIRFLFSSKTVKGAVTVVLCLIQEAPVSSEHVQIQ